MFIPAFTLAHLFRHAMSKPLIFVDVRASDYCMDPVDLERRIGEAKAKGLNPKLIIAVDLFGIPADYEAIFPIAEKHGLLVMADAAQSFGCKYDGRYAGNIAPVTATSFFPAKSLGCYGDGSASTSPRRGPVGSRANRCAGTAPTPRGRKACAPA